MVEQQEISDMIEEYITCFNPKVDSSTRGEIMKKITLIFEEKHNMEDDVRLASRGLGFLYDEKTKNKIKGKLSDPQGLSEIEKQIYGFYDGLKDKKIRNIFFMDDKIYMKGYDAGHNLSKQKEV